MHEKEHLLKVLEETKKALKEDNVLKLKELSNQTVHTSSVEQDTDSIMIAVIIYSLSKIIERKNPHNAKQCSDFCRFASEEIDKAINSLKKNDEKSFNQNLEEIIKRINKLSSNFKKYMQDVFAKARINKASKIYEHGISMEQTAKLLGITMYELAGYVGQREDRTTPLTKTQSVKDRIKLAMKMFEK
ncbi:MAG: hypothetical protein AABX28_03670 [Nanoarchaeota archaeon]